MKEKCRVLIGVLMVMSGCLQASEERIPLSFETISAETIQNSFKYRVLDRVNSGHHKTIIRMESYSEGDLFELTITRPLLLEKDRKIVNDMPYNKTKGNAIRICETTPNWCLSGCGFFPGEEVSVVVRSKKNNKKSKKIKIKPNPMVQKSCHDEAMISATLSSIFPANYFIELNDFIEGENLKIESIIGEETFVTDVKMEKGFGVGFLPGVVGQEGGVSKLTIARENGESLKLDLPWGMELVPYTTGEKDAHVKSFPNMLL